MFVIYLFQRKWINTRSLRGDYGIGLPCHHVLSTHHPWVSLVEYAPVRYAVQISTSELRVSLIARWVSSNFVISVSVLK